MRCLPTLAMLQRILQSTAGGLSEEGEVLVMKRGWQVCAAIALVAAMGGIVILAQACGGSGGESATPTAATSPTLTAGSETPFPRPGIRPGDGGTPGMPGMTPGAGPPGMMPFVGGASEEFAAFLGISFEQLESELSTEGATPASVAETHGRTRKELKTFFTEQVQAQFSEAVAAGTMSQEDADNMVERSASRIDDIIDGKMPSGGPPSTPSGQ